MAEQTETGLSLTEEKPNRTKTKKSLAIESIEQTKTRKSPSVENKGQTETKKSLPAKKEGKNKGGRPGRTEIDPPKWTIRGIDVETRNIIDKAATKYGQTLGQFFNSSIREYCTGQIKKGEQLPAGPVDIKDMIAAEMITFKTDILESIIAASPKQDKKTFTQKLKELFQ
ncbi:MAG: hypothetical protein EOP43_03845 [Sphingobacteriaceae bacterium]|nr:MAG: hypothetical protein EOP43_03845 [Sphingobacteriaceae bacterium]